MGSLVLPPPAPPDMALPADRSLVTHPLQPPQHQLLPWLSEADYLAQVLGRPIEQSEDDLDDELVAKAAALGVQLPQEKALSPPDVEPAVTVIAADHVRNLSAGSCHSDSTDSACHVSQPRRPPALTASSEPMAGGRLTRKRSRALTFSYYDKYLSEVDPNLTQPKLADPPPSAARHERTPSSVSVGSNKGYNTLTRGLADKLKWRRRSDIPSDSTVSCICCREEFDKAYYGLRSLPCGHTYCQNCVVVMINQSTTDESKMPPRCCTQPIPGSIIKTVLNRDEQTAFLKAVLQYSTPWESRIFCPNASCGEFVLPRVKIDPKHPFEVVCKSCKTRICAMCKRNAHRLGQDCPGDWELDAVLKMGEKSGWRRCYKCRTLVELDQGCTHMTCRCKAQFCYICGAVWDPVVGCPNYCNGDEEMERRRAEEEQRIADLAAEMEVRKQAVLAAETERLDAEARTRNSSEFQSLRKAQEEVRDRFRCFESKMREDMWMRHTQRKSALGTRYADLADKMRERHSKTEQALEDRQIEREMELMGTLEQEKQSERIRLRHMEGYCKSVGQPNPDNSHLPLRVVTQRDREELEQQYYIVEGLERRGKSRINQMREKQAKRMEELLERHETELQALGDKKTCEMETLALDFTNEEEALSRLFTDRRARMMRRWELAVEILRTEVEMETGLKYGCMPLPAWPTEPELHEDDSTAVEDIEGSFQWQEEKEAIGDEPSGVQEEGKRGERKEEEKRQVRLKAEGQEWKEMAREGVVIRAEGEGVVL